MNKTVSLTDSFLKRYDIFRVFLIHCIDYSMADTLTMIFVFVMKSIRSRYFRIVVGFVWLRKISKRNTRLYQCRVLGMTF